MKELIGVLLIFLQTCLLCSFAFSENNHNDSTFVRDRFHIFYYLWYGNPENDGRYLHWDHEVLPHWESRINARYLNIGQRHFPPNNIHAPFYPLRGLYSSQDPNTLRQHFQEIVNAGVGLVVVSWWGQKTNSASSDTQGVSTDEKIPLLMSVAQDFPSLRVAFHLEPYKGRSASSIFEDIRYIVDNYSNYTSFYKTPSGLPIYYVYDSYHLVTSEWARLLRPEGEFSVRQTPYDGIFFGLWLNVNDGVDLEAGGFDGAYTYFASKSFSYGSTPSNWRTMRQFCHRHNMALSISIGPGYIDTGIRPWNDHNTRDRRDGKYYQDMFRDAILAEPDILSITSYNEWGEGTQIEAAQRVDWTTEKKYLDYGNLNGTHFSNRYIEMTRSFSDVFYGSSLTNTKEKKNGIDEDL